LNRRTGLGEPWISEAGVTGLGDLQGGLGALADDLALAFGKRRPQVQGEAISIDAKLGHDESNLVRHQAGDEMHVTRKPVELRHGHGTLAVTTRVSQCRGELRALLNCVEPLPCFDLSELCDNFKPFALREPRDCLALNFNAEAGTALLANAPSIIRDQRASTWGAPLSVL
jgi:hypothetical protein